MQQAFTAHPVKIGMSDGSNTEILEGIAEGSQVVTETIVKRAKCPKWQPGENGDEQNLFMPGPPKETKRKINKEQP